MPVSRWLQRAVCLLVLLVSPSAQAACGDGATDGFEECDGTDDGSCPGRCSDDCACPTLPAGGDLEVHVIDVGQGDAILVVSPDGFTMLVDAGTESNDATIQAALAALGIGGLDYVLVSHMDADHVGGVDGVLAAHPEVVACFDHGGSHTTQQYSQYDAAAAGRRTPVAVGRRIDLGPSVIAEVLHASVGATDDNDNSAVLRLTHGETTVLLGGDCSGACESRFDPGRIDVYMVHHHGSASSSTVELLDRMDPYTALVSVGATNPYGHPTAEVLDRLAAAGAAVYRTDLDGDLTLVSDGTSYTVEGEPVCLAGEARACGTDVGACTTGVAPCDAGMWGTCSGVGPAPEDCGNGIDDDCDGTTDAGDADCSGAGATTVVLAQVSYDTPGTDSAEEFVDLYNPGTAPVALDGYTLSDGVDTWIVPAGTVIAPDTYLSIARQTAGFTALYGFAPQVSGLTLSLNNTGDVVVLADPAGAELDRVAWEGFEPGWTLTASSRTARPPSGGDPAELLLGDPRVHRGVRGLGAGADRAVDSVVLAQVPRVGPAGTGGGSRNQKRNMGAS
jgi:competence protein ComEC